MEIWKASPNYTCIGLSAVMCLKFKSHKESKKIAEMALIVQPKCWMVQGIIGLNLRRTKSEEQEEWMTM